MLTIVVLLLVLWAFGFGFAGLGPLIHILLIVALILALFQFMAGRSSPGGLRIAARSRKRSRTEVAMPLTILGQPDI